MLTKMANKYKIVGRRSHLCIFLVMILKGVTIMYARKLKVPLLEKITLPQEGRLIRVKLIKVEGNAKKETFEGMVMHQYPNFILIQQQKGAKLRTTYQNKEFLNKHVIFEYLD